MLKIRYISVRLILILSLLLPVVTHVYSHGVSRQLNVQIEPSDGSITPDTRTSEDPLIGHSSDLSIPKPTQLKWKFDNIPGILTYDIFLSKDSLLDSTDLLVSNYSDTVIPVWNLKIGKKYYWQIVVRAKGTLVEKTDVFTFNTPSLWPRMIYIDGTTNVRDIGGRANKAGQQIQQGLFFRSADLNVHNIITDLGMRQLLDLGIRSEIDLRYYSEGAQPSLPSYIHYFQPKSDVGGLYAYAYGLQKFGVQYRDVFKEIAKAENYPMICHCWAGADRTGTVAALLESLLDCSEKQIELDYEWTSLSCYGTRDTNYFGWKEMISEIKSFDSLGGTLQVGAMNYLISNGVTVGEIDKIRTLFLSPDSTLLPKPAVTPRRSPKGYLLPSIGKSAQNLPLSNFKTFGINGRLLSVNRGKSVENRRILLRMSNMIMIVQEEKIDIQ
jgi:hypothetical protein